VFKGLLKASFDVVVGNLIDILTRNRRLELLPEIEQQFRALKNAHESAAEAKIVSAFPISESELGQLITALQKKFGRTLMPSVSVDPTLIGGVCVTIGDEVLDTSVKARLQQMQTVLAA
jgi:F-type H+-transporting ATPase subunit delta